MIFELTSEVSSTVAVRVMGNPPQTDSGSTTILTTTGPLVSIAAPAVNVQLQSSAGDPSEIPLLFPSKPFPSKSWIFPVKVTVIVSFGIKFSEGSKVKTLLLL